MEPKVTLSHDLVGKPVCWSRSIRRRIRFGLVVGVDANPGREAIEIYDGQRQFAVRWDSVLSLRVVGVQKLIERIYCLDSALEKIRSQLHISDLT